jgi:V8-like Glu-specific endopeptidase
MKKENSCWYTVPGIYGSSGSGVLNDKGELIGILTFALTSFHNVTGGVSIDDVNNIIEKNLR